MLRRLAPPVIGRELLLLRQGAHVSVDEAHLSQRQQRVDVRIGLRGRLQRGLELVDLLRIFVIASGQGLELANQRRPGPGHPGRGEQRQPSEQSAHASMLGAPAAGVNLKWRVATAKVGTMVKPCGR